MSAVTLMLLAWGALILGHWANNQNAVSVKQIVEMVFALLLIAFLESNGKTEPIAKGLAVIFLVSVLLGSKSVVSGISKIGTTTTAKPVKKGK
jgi:hypothetical protein